MIAQTYTTPAAAANNTKVSVVRTADSTNILKTTVARDVYRTEDYQANYTVEVPYQDTETYWESVPYEEQESYTDWEVYYERERVCRTETEYKDSCHDVRKCEPVFENRCERRRVCSLNMPAAVNFAMALFGSNISHANDAERAGRERREREDNDRRQREERERRDRDNRERENREREGRERRDREDRERRDREERDRREREERGRREREERERKDREERDRRDREERERRCNKEVCERVKTGETCRNERECRRIAHPVQKCDYEQVRKTRAVTKYRWVTKYRQEARTRTVTRHRTETRCCVTRQREVLDHQYTAQVEVRFPTNASLIGTESEKFNVELKGYDAQASVTITPVSSIYKYEPRINKVSADQFVIDMILVPTYQPADLAENTVDKFQLSALGNITQLTFVDMGTVAKVQNSYELILTDATGAELLRDTYDPKGQAQVRWQLPLAIPANTEVRAQLTVKRDGVVIAAPVQFTVDKILKVQAEAKYDITPYTDKNQVGKFSLGGSGKKLIIYFRDLTKDIAQVKTEYTFKVSLVEKAGPRVLAEKTFLREHLTMAADGRIPLAAAEAFGIEEADLALLTSGKTLLIEGQVVRNGTRFPNGSFAIPKKVTLAVP